jgi:acyl carrier protein
VFLALRVLRLGAEPINSEDIKLFRRHFSPDCVLLHAIGPSETGTIRRHFITHEWHSGDSKVPLGYAVPDKEILLLDEAGRELGADQIGEIAVRSKYLALGYWRRLDLTQAAFIGDPSGTGEPLFLTGDLGLMRPDGCLIHMGRKDFQVKIRGYRVEVAEIEVALLGLGSIKAAVVHPQADDAGETCLVAYVVPAPGEGPTVSDLRRALAQTLPNYMVPSAYVFLDALPVLTNGKVDRRALPLPDQERPKLRCPYVPPQNAVERELIEIWEEVLRVHPIGVDDSFFDLGGHSLTATRVVSRVIKKFQLKISLPSLFHSPTVAEMATVITKSNGRKLGEKDLDRILTELESLSDEEAKRLLADQGEIATRN